MAIINVDKERDLQKLIELNLNTVLDITFLASEFSTSFGGRIDTLGIDRNGAPVIIEYKKVQNNSVINQGLSYLLWLLDHKASFENLCKQRNLNINVNWEAPRLICIAESYNKFDLDTANLLQDKINIELFRYRIYEGDILYLESENYQRVYAPQTGLLRNKKTSVIKTRLQKDYSLEWHLNKGGKTTRGMFLKLRELIMSLDDRITEEAKAKYIAYKLNTNFTDIEIWPQRLKVYLNLKSGQLRDPYGIAKDLTKPRPIGHWGNGDYRIILEKEEDIPKVFELIKQSYKFRQ